MELLVSLSLAFVLSMGFNIYAAREVGRLHKKVRDRDDLIDDLRAAVGGTETQDWRKLTL
ncbi:MAG: hypothetical protein ACYCZ0_00140 [Minisyncoccota bacterium]